jgi:hypothetical protein
MIARETKFGTKPATRSILYLELAHFNESADWAHKSSNYQASLEIMQRHVRFAQIWLMLIYCERKTLFVR